MTYWEHLKEFANDFDKNSWFRMAVSKYAEVLEHKSSFFDGIPDDHKWIETIIIFKYIHEYEDCQNHDYRTQSGIPSDIINNDIKTIESTIELIQRFRDNKNFVHVGEFDSNDQNDAFKMDIEKFIDISETILNDLQLMQKNKKKTKSEDLMLLRKRAYYADEITKDRIEDIIKDILRKHSLPIDFISVRDFVTGIKI